MVRLVLNFKSAPGFEIVPLRVMNLLQAISQNPFYGGVVEWFMTPDSKSGLTATLRGFESRRLIYLTRIVFVT